MTDELGRLTKAGAKAGLSPEAAQVFAAAVAKELNREREAVDRKLSELKHEMEKLQLRITIKLGVVSVVVISVLSGIMALMKFL